MLNRTTIMGRLTADVELRKTQSGTPVAAFTVAVERDFKGQNGEKETDFINCVAWKHTAEFITKYFKKGSIAVISGRLQTRNYDGGRRLPRKGYRLFPFGNVYRSHGRSSKDGCFRGADATFRHFGNVPYGYRRSGQRQCYPSQ